MGRDRDQDERDRREDAPDEGRRAGAGGRGRPLRSIVPWRERVRDVLVRLREYGRAHRGPEIEAGLRERFGAEAGAADVADLQRAFDDWLCVPGALEDGRSLVRAFAEEEPDLTAEERQSLPLWEEERTHRVYLLDRGSRERLDLWDPIAGGRVGIQLVEKMTPGRAAALRRGCVVTATSAPWAGRRIALGRVEIYDGDDAIDLYRKQVRQGGRVWHDLPPAAPVS